MDSTAILCIDSHVDLTLEEIAELTSHNNLVAGQVFEFLVWAELERQSMGALHVFLPLGDDRGIDGIVHRRTDDTYIPVQVKGRSQWRAPIGSGS